MVERSDSTPADLSWDVIVPWLPHPSESQQLIPTDDKFAAARVGERTLMNEAAWVPDDSIPA